MYPSSVASLNGHNFSSGGPISMIIWFYESSEGALSDGMLKSQTQLLAGWWATGSVVGYWQCGGKLAVWWATSSVVGN